MASKLQPHKYKQREKRKKEKKKAFTNNSPSPELYCKGTRDAQDMSGKCVDLGEQITMEVIHSAPKNQLNVLKPIKM